MATLGPSVCDKIFRVTPDVAAGGAPCADASLAMNSVSPQIAHDAKPANPRRVSMISSLLVSESSAPSGLTQIVRLSRLGWQGEARTRGPRFLVAARLR